MSDYSCSKKKHGRKISNNNNRFVRNLWRSLWPTLPRDIPQYWERNNVLLSEQFFLDIYNIYHTYIKKDKVGEWKRIPHSIENL